MFVSARGAQMNLHTSDARSLTLDSLNSIRNNVSAVHRNFNDSFCCLTHLTTIQFYLMATNQSVSQRALFLLCDELLPLHKNIAAMCALNVVDAQ
jgi:hypothetical protein